MIKTLCLTALTCAMLSAPAFADENIEFPLADPTAPRAQLAGEIAVITPYEHAFRVRVFTTPQRGPLYNVPAYAVVTPY